MLDAKQLIGQIMGTGSEGSTGKGSGPAGIAGGALQVDDRLAAYTIAEQLPDGSTVIHFEKGDPDYKGSYQAINQMFLQNDPGVYTLVNREQDLGNDGLRKAKLSYHPVDFVRKYRVSL